MSDICDIVHIPIVDTKSRFWMVRTQKGAYYDEFVRRGFIAIGWNQLLASTLRIDHSKKQLELIKDRLRNVYKEKIPGAAYNKCKRFFSEISNGDIVMIVDNDRITFAYIGDYYEEQDETLTVENEIETDAKIDLGLYTESIPCPYVKRRSITQIKSISTSDAMNPYLIKAMSQNRHCLSSLDDYGRIILSTCYDIYQLGEELTVTFRVEKKDEISPLVFANFILSASNILLPTSETQISINTNIHSPGDISIFTKIDALLEQIPVLVLYVAIVGGRFKDFEVPSIIDFLKKVTQVKRNKEIQDIELETMRENLKASKLENRKKELEIYETETRLSKNSPDNDEVLKRLNIIEANFDKLQETSAQLEIKPFDDKVISFDDIKVYTMRNRSSNN